MPSIWNKERWRHLEDWLEASVKGALKNRSFTYESNTICLFLALLIRRWVIDRRLLSAEFFSVPHTKRQLARSFSVKEEKIFSCTPIGNDSIIELVSNVNS